MNNSFQNIPCDFCIFITYQTKSIVVFIKKTQITIDSMYIEKNYNHDKLLIHRFMYGISLN